MCNKDSISENLEECIRKPVTEEHREISGDSRPSASEVYYGDDLREITGEGRKKIELTTNSSTGTAPSTSATTEEDTDSLIVIGIRIAKPRQTKPIPRNKDRKTLNTETAASAIAKSSKHSRIRTGKIEDKDKGTRHSDTALNNSYRKLLPLRQTQKSKSVGALPCSGNKEKDRFGESCLERKQSHLAKSSSNNLSQKAKVQSHSFHQTKCLSKEKELKKGTTRIGGNPNVKPITTTAKTVDAPKDKAKKLARSSSHELSQNRIKPKVQLHSFHQEKLPSKEKDIKRATTKRGDSREAKSITTLAKTVDALKDKAKKVARSSSHEMSHNRIKSKLQLESFHQEKSLSKEKDVQRATTKLVGNREAKPITTLAKTVDSPKDNVKKQKDHMANMQLKTAQHSKSVQRKSTSITSTETGSKPTPTQMKRTSEPKSQAGSKMKTDNFTTVVQHVEAVGQLGEVSLPSITYPKTIKL